MTKRSGAYCKNKGNAYERQIAKELRELGFKCVVTSRSESKSTDDDKIDLIDKCGELPFNIQIQLKKTTSTPSYFKIRKQSSVDNESFVIIWNKQKKATTNMVSDGEVVMIDKNLFYKLIKNYANNTDASNI